MNLRQMEVFLAVAESGSFTRGAEASFISQSTVSQHIADLEAEFGVRLMDRTGKKALPTAAGKILLQRVRRILHGVRETELTMRRFASVEDAPLAVGASNVPGNYLIPLALSILVKRFPGLALMVRCGDSREALELLCREEVELAVVGSRSSDDRFAWSPLVEDRVILIVGKGHRFGGRQVTIAELASEPFILREPGSGTGRAVETAMREAGIAARQLTVRARLGSNEAVKQAVAAGAGISFVSAFSVERELACGALVRAEVPEMTIRRQFCLAHLAGRDLSPAAETFATILRECHGCPPSFSWLDNT